jgi:hypothetical protein
MTPPFSPGVARVKDPGSGAADFRSGVVDFRFGAANFTGAGGTSTR